MSTVSQFQACNDAMDQVSSHLTKEERADAGALGAKFVDVIDAQVVVLLLKHRMDARRVLEIVEVALASTLAGIHAQMPFVPERQ